MIDVTFDMFFDRPLVEAKVKGGTKSVLSKIGAYTRRDMKGLIRRGKRSARPGNPPKSHTGLLKDLIFFGYDDMSESVVIGPKLFKRSDPTVPELLEFGGTRQHRSGKRLTYDPHPYAAPAQEKNVDLFARLMANAVR